MSFPILEPASAAATAYSRQMPMKRSLLSESGRGSAHFAIRWLASALVALTLSTAGAMSASAQNVIVRGLDPDLLVDGTDTLSVYLVRGAELIPTGMIIDEIERVEEDGTMLLRRVYRVEDEFLGTRRDTVFDMAANLAAVRYRSIRDRSTEILDFSDDHVRGWSFGAGGDTVEVDVRIRPGTYNGAQLDLILRAAPLAPDWETEVRAFVSSRRRTVPLYVWVEGEETVAGEPTWRVKADYGADLVTFWIHRDSRKLVQQIIDLSPALQVLIRRGAPPRPDTGPRSVA